MHTLNVWLLGKNAVACWPSKHFFYPSKSLFLEHLTMYSTTKLYSISVKPSIL